jgi:hypothetical protein
MLSTIAFSFAVMIVLAAVVQLLVAAYFRRLISRRQIVSMPLEKQQSVAVMLCVRGCDPSLRHALIGILNQEFVSYQVHLVVDHRSDAAWDVVQEIKREHDLNDILKIHEMQGALETCGLKCNALLQGLKELPDNTKYLALMDADVRPHASWLAELTGPLERDPEIGLVTGNQWFEPPEGSNWGSLVRSMWNAGALVPTAIFQNPWAGTLAMRIDDLHRSDLPHVWQHSVVDDGPLRQVMKKLGLKIYFAPSLIMINREKCTFSYVNRWVTRMLTWSRLYESTFFLSVIHSIFSNTVMVACRLLLVAALLTANVWAMACTTMALVASGLLSVAAYSIVRSTVGRSARIRGESLPPIGLPRIGKLTLTVAVAQLIYLVSCLRAIFSQEVQWREITYELMGKTQVKRMNYQPIEQTAEEVGSNQSL